MSIHRGIYVEQVTDAIADLGEAPVWDVRSQTLYWVDMFAGDVLGMSSSGGILRHHVGDLAAAVRPRRTGGFVLALSRGFATTDADFTEVTEMRPLWHRPDVRMNEGGCDPHGRFYCGSMACDAEARAGRLYRLDADGSTSAVLTGVTVSSGLAWSPDGDSAYYVDSATQCIDLFDYDARSGIHNRRPWVRVDPADGTPDGLTVDSEGGVWVAVWGGGAVRRYDENGQLEHVEELPARQVTACTFGGRGLDQLYVTTSRRGIGSAAEPAAGALFVLTPGVKGLAALDYRG